jgi:hypothetical protein
VGPKEKEEGGGGEIKSRKQSKELKNHRGKGDEKKMKSMVTTR